MRVKSAILLHAPLPPHGVPRWTEALLDALPYARRLQLESRGPEACTASLGGIALVLAAAARLDGMPPAVRTLAASAEGRPRFAEGPCFSISHAATRVACVVSRCGEPGLDIETIDDTAARERLRRWTATEAVLKAAGQGLRALRDVRLDDALVTGEFGGRRYVLHHVLQDGAIVGCVAAQTALDFVIEAATLEGPEVSAAVECSLGLAAQPQ